MVFADCREIKEKETNQYLDQLNMNNNLQQLSDGRYLD